jgi:hypothetical protein
MLSVLSVWSCAIAYVVYVSRHSTRRERWFAACVFLSSGIAGMLSGGKTFYLGIALFFVMLLVIRREFKVAASCAALGLCVVCGWSYFLQEDDVVKQQFSAVLQGDFHSVLASRFDVNNGFLAETVQLLWRDNQTLLIGAGGNLEQFVIADCLFILPLATGGAIGLLLYLLPMLWLAWQLYQRSCRGDEMSAAHCALLWTFLISGIGIPVFQMGRVAPLIWIFAVMQAFAPETWQQSALRFSPRR